MCRHVLQGKGYGAQKSELQREALEKIYPGWKDTPLPAPKDPISWIKVGGGRDRYTAGARDSLAAVGRAASRCHLLKHEGEGSLPGSSYGNKKTLLKDTDP